MDAQHYEPAHRRTVLSNGYQGAPDIAAAFTLEGSLAEIRELLPDPKRERARYPQDKMGSYVMPTRLEDLLKQDLYTAQQLLNRGELEGARLLLLPHIQTTDAFIGEYESVRRRPAQGTHRTFVQAVYGNLLSGVEYFCKKLESAQQL